MADRSAVSRIMQLINYELLFRDTCGMPNSIFEAILVLFERRHMPIRISILYLLLDNNKLDLI
ncbi:hypothetical protein CENSYa_0013 [Cenarchaeum symbiosum A]|uniref:Uncharacterized protein n=1 Tax=Cenarchaeum symbiosum (strain A) TaxID=414004 RepID=A0RTK4_CENSY|nr:hypothetical protein CENSYa_0013 [Cenarchaeum symbiosum A]